MNLLKRNYVCKHNNLHPVGTNIKMNIKMNWIKPKWENQAFLRRSLLQEATAKPACSLYALCRGPGVPPTSLQREVREESTWEVKEQRQAVGLSWDARVGSDDQKSKFTGLKQNTSRKGILMKKQDPWSLITNQCRTAERRGATWTQKAKQNLVSSQEASTCKENLGHYVQRSQTLADLGLILTWTRPAMKASAHYPGLFSLLQP